MKPLQHCVGPYPPGSGPFSNHGASDTHSLALSRSVLLAWPARLAVPHLHYVVGAAPASTCISRSQLPPASRPLLRPRPEEVSHLPRLHSASWRTVRLENWLKHQLEGGLDHPIPHGGDA